MLDVMLSVVNDFSDYQFVIAGAPSMPMDFYKKITQNSDSQQIIIIKNKTYDLLQHAEAALVTSGTATLETGLFNVPQVVCYQGNGISFQIAKRIVNVKYISLVNLILDQELVKELIQNDFNKENLTIELQKILNPKKSKAIKNGYLSLREKLGQSGASKRTATKMIEALKKK